MTAASSARFTSLRGTEAMLEGGHWQTGRVPERDLVVLSEEPLNAETKLDEQRGATVPAGRHYVRTHFGIPAGPREVLITGPVRDSTPGPVSLDAIRTLPPRTQAHSFTRLANMPGRCSCSSIAAVLSSGSAGPTSTPRTAGLRSPTTRN